MKFENLHKILCEEFNTKDYNTKIGKTLVSLIIGRFQPFHIGHASLLVQAKNKIIIGIVKGAGSSKDKLKNPFDYKLQYEIIKKANLSKIEKIIEIKDAFLPNIISQLRDDNYEVVELLAGTDRVKSYQIMNDKYGPQINSNVIIKELVRDESDTGVSGVSATKVRNAISADEFESAKNMMVSLDKSLFKKMQKNLGKK